MEMVNKNFNILTLVQIKINTNAYSKFTDNRFNIPMFYLHRILRITPALATVIFFQMTLFKYLGDGPLWNIFTESLILPCEKKWWTTLLHVQNYLNSDSMVYLFFSYFSRSYILISYEINIFSAFFKHGILVVIFNYTYSHL